MEKFISTAEVVAEATKSKRSLIHAQEVLGIEDDSRINQMMRDGMVASYLGFDATNNGTTGWDAANTTTGVNLESKTNSIKSKSYKATFQDTTVAKASRFGNGDVVVALSVFSDVFTPMFAVVGNNPAISQELLERSNKKRLQGVRPNVVIPMKSLINKYGYKVVALDASKEEVLNHLQSKYKRGFKNLTVDDIYTSDEVDFTQTVEA